MTARRNVWSTAWPALPLLAFLLVIYGWPVSRLLITSLTLPTPGLAQYARLLSTPVYAAVYWRSLALASVVTAATVILSYPLAWHMTLQSAARRRWLMVIILVPSSTSVLVRSFGWMILLGRHGVVNAVLIATGISARPVQLMFGTPAVAMAMVAILLPYAVIPLTLRMRTLDGALLPAARGLGANGIRCFWHVHLPLCMPAVIAGASLTFVLGLGFFITPALLGGPRNITAAMLIMQQFQALLNWGFGAALSAVLLCLAGLVLLVFAAVGSRATRGLKQA